MDGQWAPLDFQWATHEGPAVIWTEQPIGGSPHPAQSVPLPVWSVFPIVALKVVARAATAAWQSDWLTPVPYEQLGAAGASRK